MLTESFIGIDLYTLHHIGAEHGLTIQPQTVNQLHVVKLILVMTGFRPAWIAG